MTDASGNTGTSSCESPGRGRGGRGSAAEGGEPRCHGDDPFSRALWRWPGGRSSNSLHDLELQFYDCVVSVCACLLFFSLPQKRRMSHFPSPPPYNSARPRRRSDSIASHKTIIKEAIRVAKLATPPACKCGRGRARRSQRRGFSRYTECLHPPDLVSGKREPSRTAHNHVP